MQPASNIMEGALSIQRFDNVPAFAGKEMDRLYGSLFSCLSTLDAHGDVNDEVRTCVMSIDDNISHILLYRITGHCLRVMNEGIKLGYREIQRFSEFAFSTYPRVHAITWHAIETERETDPCTSRFHFPQLRHNCLEDMIISLPADVDAYLSSLGKSTQRTIKSYAGKLKKDHPSFRIDVAQGLEIDQRDIDAIIGYNRTRMARLGKVSNIDDIEDGRIRRMARTHGLVCTMRIGDRVIGGTINYRVGDNFFGYVQGYDAEYERYRTGFLLYYVTVCECIRRGGKLMNLLWGRYEYKFLLGASLRELDHVTIYRSRTQMLLHPKNVLGDMSRGWKRQAQLWVQYKFVKKNKALANLLRQARFAMRSARRKLTTDNEVGESVAT